MNVLFITSDFPHAYDPVNGLFNKYLAGGLLHEGHEVRVVCPISWIMAGKGRVAGQKLRMLNDVDGLNRIKVSHPLYWYPPRFFRGSYGTFMWWSARRELRRVVSGFRPDVVLAYWAHPDGEVAVRIARELGVASGVIIGGSDVLLLTKDAARREKIVRVLAETDAVFTVNEHLKKKVESFGISPHKVHKWDQGVDEKFSRGSKAEARQRLGIASAERVVMWVGRMVPVKALEVLMDAAGRMKDNGTSFKLCLIGDGELRPGLEKTAVAKGLTEVVRFVGSQTHDQLPDWYRAADVTVLPSWSEGLPNVLRESLACGTPFVASRVGGIAEIAGDRLEWLVEAGDAAGLAAALTRMLSEPQGLPEVHHVSTWQESARALISVFQPRRAGAVCEAVPA